MAFPLSSLSSRSFAARPPANPVSDPLDPMTRWHGAMIEIGFLPFAAPTARNAVGLPICLAMSA
jgi:outer membrane usher protein